ncbi:MAG: hypothetical protein HQL07_08185 [Nitrospirae bacterium]|nr:hypothetical protein [Magnetococcales bacterium]
MKKILRKSTETIAGMVVGGVAVLTISSAFSFALPFTFSNGTPANADQVNANFNALKDRSASPTLVSGGTTEIGALLGFSSSNYSGMSRQGYMFQISNTGLLMPLQSTTAVSTSLQSKWDAAIASFRSILTSSQGGTNLFSSYNDGTLYFDSACSVTATPTTGALTNSQENSPNTYVSVPSIPPRHIYKISGDSRAYVFTGNEPTFNGASQSFSFTPYFKATSNGTSTSYCAPFATSVSTMVPAYPLGTATITWSGTLPTTSFSTVLTGGPYFQNYPTNLNNQATTGVPDAGFATPISIEMR